MERNPEAHTFVELTKGRLSCKVMQPREFGARVHNASFGVEHRRVEFDMKDFCDDQGLFVEVTARMSIDAAEQLIQTLQVAVEAARDPSQKGFP